MLREGCHDRDLYIRQSGRPRCRLKKEIFHYLFSFSCSFAEVQVKDLWRTGALMVINWHLSLSLSLSLLGSAVLWFWSDIRDVGKKGYSLMVREIVCVSGWWSPKKDLCVCVCFHMPVCAFEYNSVCNRIRLFWWCLCTLPVKSLVSLDSVYVSHDLTFCPEGLNKV